MVKCIFHHVLINPFLSYYQRLLSIFLLSNAWNYNSLAVYIYSWSDSGWLERNEVILTPLMDLTVYSIYALCLLLIYIVSFLIWYVQLQIVF